MKATEVYITARKTISEWCKGNGFTRMKSGRASWCKPFANNFIVFWFQCSKDGYDTFAGSKFIVEFQVSKVAEIGEAKSSRWRFSHFLRKDEKEFVRKLQNQVISKLEKPSKNYFIYQMEKETIDWYLEKFEPNENEYGKLEDIWFCYKDKEDIEVWMNYVKQKLPDIFSSISKKRKL